jgi:hypothetical protein
MTDKWKLVPIEPTEQMIDAYLKTGLAQTFYHDAYKAMLNAAPSPEQAKQEPVYQVGVGYGSTTTWYDKSKQEYDEITIVERVQKRVLYTSPQVQADLQDAELTADMKKVLLFAHSQIADFDKSDCKDHSLKLSAIDASLRWLLNQRLKAKG